MIRKHNSTKMIVSLILVLMIIMSSVLMLGNTITVKAAASPYITSGGLYYIKNVYSGKYVTVPDSTLSDGTRIEQQTYSASDYQKWYVTYTSTGTYGGFYKITAYKNTNKALAMESASSNNGVYLGINTSASTTKQYFKLNDLSNTAHVIYTNGSNCLKALRPTGSSILSYVTIQQGTYSSTAKSYQWLFEPVSGYKVTNALSYAVANKNDYLVTYPNLTNFNFQGDDNQINLENNIDPYDYWFFSESTNYVSQCLSAGGKHYDNDQIVNKSSTNMNNPLTPYELKTGWSYNVNNCPWLESTQFYDHWKIGQTTNNYTLSNIINNSGNASSGSYGIGDVVLFQALYSELGNEYVTDYVVYITATPTPSDKGSYTAVFHNWGGFTNTATIRQLCQNYAQNNGTRRVVFMNF